MISLICGTRKGCKGTYLPTKSDVESKLMVTARGKGDGRELSETVIDICTLIYKIDN